jgi:hypothetical protein
MEKNDDVLVVRSVEVVGGETPAKEDIMHGGVWLLKIALPASELFNTALQHSRSTATVGLTIILASRPGEHSPSRGSPSPPSSSPIVNQPCSAPNAI